MHKQLKGRLFKGDTLIEVMFAMGIFGLASVGTISLMNKGLANAQNTLEVAMARQEIDTQAEVLRFLHNAYILTKDELSEEPCKDPKSYRDIWKCITTNYTYPHDADHTNEWVTHEDSEFYTRTTVMGESCDELYRLSGNDSFSIPNKSFVLNPRRLGSAELDITDLKKIITDSETIGTSGTYPRLIYEGSENDNLSDATITNNIMKLGSDTNKTIEKSEGIWITGVASESGINCKKEDSNEFEFRPDYYDFHIKTCWDSVASDMASTINTTVRLFNPNQVEPVNKSAELTLDTMGLYFVMTWTGSNSDIDAHLEGVDGTQDRPEGVEGRKPLHVFFGAKEAGEVKQYSFTSKPVYTFQLDVDALDRRNYCSKKDKNCNSGADGFIEIIAIRSLFPGSFNYYLHDFSGEGFPGNNIKVRVYVGQADSGIGVWPKTDGQLIATFKYKTEKGQGGILNVIPKLEVQQDGSFVIDGKTIKLSNAIFGSVKVEISCKRTLDEESVVVEH